jgi:ABC-type ATPase involved in cell division
VKIEIHHECSDFNSFRANKCKSLFNVESGCNFDLEAELPIDDNKWNIGLVVGPSGSGKTSIGKEIFGLENFYNPKKWGRGKPIIDLIGKKKTFTEVTKVLAGVGLGSVPTWLRPYRVLSNGEKFRANLAKIILKNPRKVVVDEFTSVVDRQVAKVGSHAFAKNWRRNKKPGKCVLLSCHYDIIDWLEPDWVYDIATGKYQGRGLWRRPKIKLKVYEGDWSHWEVFRPHHYLKVGRMPASQVYIGVVDKKVIAHYAVARKPKGKNIEVRGARFVVLPEWQGLAIGGRFVRFIGNLQLAGKGLLKGKRSTMLATTSHPGLAASRRRDPRWQQVTCPLHGQDRGHAFRTNRRKGKVSGFQKFGGHFRSVQGFRYIGENPRKEDITTKFRGGKVRQLK